MPSAYAAFLLAQGIAPAALEAPAQPPAADTAVIRYDPGFFARFNAANALEMVERLPGFSFEAGADVRGYEGAAGNVLIDGQRPSSKSDTLDEVLRRIPTSRVARIELIRGGAPGVDMARNTVVANVVRKPGGGLRGLVSQTVNYVAEDGRTAPILRLEASGGADSRRWEVGFRTGIGIADSVGDGPRTRVAPDGTLVGLAEIESEAVTAQTSLTGSYEARVLGGDLRANGRVYVNEYEFDLQGRNLLPEPYVELDHYGQDTKGSELGGRFRWTPTRRGTAEITGLHRLTRVHYGETIRNPGTVVFFSTEQDGGEAILRGTYAEKATARLSWETGLEGAFNWQDSQTRYQQDGTPVVVPAGDVRVEERRGEAFVKGAYQVDPRWLVEADLRQEVSRISSTGDVVLAKTLSFTKPRLAVTWAPETRTQVRLRVERTVDQLDFADFVATSELNNGGGVQAGNPDLEPERAWVLEAAVERRFRRTGVVILTARRSYLDDVIDIAPVFSPSGVFDAPANIGSGTLDELSISFTLPLSGFGWRGAELKAQGTRRWSEVTDPTTGETRGISGLRPVEWEAHFTHDLPRWRTTWGVDVTGGWRQALYRVNEVQLRKLKTFVVAYAEWKPREDLSIRAELQNLTSRGYRNTRYRYAGPRSVGTLQVIDDRDLQFGPMVYLRIRKTFGG